MKKGEYKDMMMHIRVINEIEKVLELDIDYDYQRIIIKKIIERWRR